MLINETERQLMQVGYEDLTRKSKFIESVKELEDLKEGEIIQINLIGPMVYEGRIDGKLAFMTHLNSSGNGSPFISSFRGKGPYIATDGERILDFHSWITELYGITIDEDLYNQKVKMIIDAVR